MLHWSVVGKTELSKKAKISNLPVGVHSYPHLRSGNLDHDHKKEIPDTSGTNELAPWRGWALPWTEVEELGH